MGLFCVLQTSGRPGAEGAVPPCRFAVPLKAGQNFAKRSPVAKGYPALNCQPFLCGHNGLTRAIGKGLRAGKQWGNQEKGVELPVCDLQCSGDLGRGSPCMGRQWRRRGGQQASKLEGKAAPCRSASGRCESGTCDRRPPSLRQQLTARCVL